MVVSRLGGRVVDVVLVVMLAVAFAITSTSVRPVGVSGFASKSNAFASASGASASASAVSVVAGVHVVVSGWVVCRVAGTAVTAISPAPFKGRNAVANG